MPQYKVCARSTSKFFCSNENFTPANSGFCDWCCHDTGLVWFSRNHLPLLCSWALLMQLGWVQVLPKSSRGQHTIMFPLGEWEGKTNRKRHRQDVVDSFKIFRFRSDLFRTPFSPSKKTWKFTYIFFKLMCFINEYFFLLESNINWLMMWNETLSWIWTTTSVSRN